MAFELFANGTTTTTLDGGVSQGAGTVTVSDGSVFPSTGNFRIRVNDELMRVTARSGNDLTVDRGVEGTQEAAHDDGDDVDFYVTAGSVEQYRADSVQSGALASRPATAKEGVIYLPTDAPYLFRYDGSAWEAYAPVFRGPFRYLTPLVSGDFSWVNQGTATLSTARGSLRLHAPDVGTGDNLRLLVKSVPSTPYTIDVKLQQHGPSEDSWQAGVVWRQSSNGRLVTWHWSMKTTEFRLSHVKWNSPTVLNSGYGAEEHKNIPGQPPQFLRLEDDGTNRKVHYSPDGWHWVEFFSVGRTDFLTADQAGIFVNNNSVGGSEGASACFYHWLEG